MITEADLVVTETPREGWAVAAEGGESLALDLHITDSLHRAGVAREIVRAVQGARKQAGFDVSDRISVWWDTTDPMVHLALTEHRALIAQEVLATAFSEGTQAASSAAIAVTVPETSLGILISRSGNS